MSKVVSMRDFLRIPAFYGYREIDLIHPSMDEVLKPYAAFFGIDVEYPVEYLVNNHRDLFNQTGIGYRMVGSIRCDREFINSPMSDITDRIAVSGYSDPSLTRELGMLVNRTIDFGAFAEAGDEVADEDYADCDIEEDFDQSTATMKTLQNILIQIRGTNTFKFPNGKYA